MDRWFEEAEGNAMPGAKMFLVGSKSDKVQQRRVSEEEGKALADRWACGFCEVSAKTKEGVRRPFVEIVGEIVGDQELMKGGPRKGTVAVGGEGVAGGCAC